MVILDIMGVRGFDLLELAVSRDFRVAVLTANALNPEALKRSFEMKARAYPPRRRWAKSFPSWKMYSGMTICLDGSDFSENWKTILIRVGGNPGRSRTCNSGISSRKTLLYLLVSDLSMIMSLPVIDFPWTKNN